MKLIRKAGKTSQTLNIFIADSSSTTGAGLTGLVYNTSNLVAYYVRPAAAAAAITLATQTTTGAWSSGGFIEVSSTNMPGVYRLDIPDAVIAAGVDSVLIMLKGATNMAPLPIEIDLDGQVDVTHWLGTVVATPATDGIPDVNVKNIDNDAASASGTVTFPNATLASTTNITAGTITTATNVTNRVTANTDQLAGQTVTAAAGVTFPTSVASPTNITAGTITTATNVTTVNGLAANVITAAATAADFGAEIATAIWTDTTAGDFTVALSVGKSVMNGVTLGTGLTVARCTLVDTLTTYTGNTVQTGDSFVRIGATGSGLTSLAPSSTALSTATWTGSLATSLTTLAGHDPGTTIGTSTLTQTQVTGGAYSVQSSSCVLGDARIANLDATVSSRAPSATALSTAQWTNTLATNLATTNATVATNLNVTVSSRQATFTADTGITFPTNFSAMDVNVTGGVGIDWGNVQNPTTSLNLSGTTIKTVTDPIAGGTDLTSILGTAITEGAAGRLAGAFTTLFNVASPVLTTASVNQTGDSFGRIGATGSGLSSLAPASTALSTVTWTGSLATNLGTTNSTVVTNLDTTVSSRSTLTQTQVTGGAYSVQSSSCVLGDARIANLDTTISSRGTSTLTQAQVTGGTYSVQSASCVLGDVRIANLDATITSRAAASTALSTTQWTNTLATNLGTTNTTVATNLNATVGSRASQTSVDDVPTNAEFASAIALLSTNAQAVKLLAAVYDSASASGNVLTLSDGATQTINLTTGARTTA